MRFCSKTHGYTVTQKIPLGQTPVLDAAIKSGAIDIYPEFTGTSLTVYKLPQTSDPQQAFQSVSSYYESNFKLTWLDAAYGLNDSYGICTSQAKTPPSIISRRWMISSHNRASWCWQRRTTAWPLPSSPLRRAITLPSRVW